MARVEERRRTGLEAWRARYEASPLREGEAFTSISGAEVEPLATPETAPVDYERDLGYPGSFPFTRGVYPSMYRGRLWTMRQFAGFGTAAETNERFRYLLDHGQTGLSCAFDMPALMGVDSDSPRALGEVGREGVAMASLEDMRVLFSGIPLDAVSTSMTINSSAAIALALPVSPWSEPEALVILFPPLVLLAGLVAIPAERPSLSASPAPAAALAGAGTRPDR